MNKMNEEPENWDHDSLSSEDLSTREDGKQDVMK